MAARPLHRLDREGELVPLLPPGRLRRFVRGPALPTHLPVADAQPTEPRERPRPGGAGLGQEAEEGRGEGGRGPREVVSWSKLSRTPS